MTDRVRADPTVADPADWICTLEAMETEVAAVEQRAEGAAPLTVAAPTAPEALARPAGPLPPELAARARALLARQETACAELADALHDVARRLSLLDHLDIGATGAPALFVDQGC